MAYFASRTQTCTPQKRARAAQVGLACGERRQPKRICFFSSITGTPLGLTAPSKSETQRTAPSRSDARLELHGQNLRVANHMLGQVDLLGHLKRSLLKRILTRAVRALAGDGKVDRVEFFNWTAARSVERSHGFRPRDMKNNIWETRSLASPCF
jgi:hypothetical protein